MSHEADRHWMQRALELAERGRGAVEPNPVVGCVLAHGDQLIAEGWHSKYGEEHAEVHAIRQAGTAARGATMYVTLEPCSHWGKTPPCSQAVIEAGIAEIVVATLDPNPEVAGTGLRQVRSAGIRVRVGECGEAAVLANGPFFKLMHSRRPWVIAKWAMTLDGRIATGSGDSRWISNDQSRRHVHRLRGQVDAILVGSRTAAMDDPLLTARPGGPRMATRVVVDSRATLTLDSQLVRTAADVPLMVVVGPQADREKIRSLRDAGCAVWQSDQQQPRQRLAELLDYLGQLQMTRVLVEGGGRLHGALLDLGQVDEVLVFVAPKLCGGAAEFAPMLGEGVAQMKDAIQLRNVQHAWIDGDLMLGGVTESAYDRTLGIHHELLAQHGG